MSYDLIIRGGTIVDGSGLPRYQADVGIKGGRITSIGKVSGPADEVIDAEGHVVAPGFLGSTRELLLLARRDVGRHGQLRLLPGPVRREGQAAGDA